MLESIAKQYGFPENECTLQPFGNGLINNTWILNYRDDQFIFQKINDSVFTSPSAIAENLHQLHIFFEAHFPDYLFVNPVATIHDEEMFFLQKIAFEGARQFGKFTKLLSAFDISKLQITLPDFHNLTLRYQQFEEALQKGNKDRIQESEASILYIIAKKNIVDIFNQIQKNPSFKKRVTHHDTKISNVLFDISGNGLCVIDLDTVMPGYFISDVGDMIRTYVSPVSEEENDFSKINIREDYFQAIVDGYLSEMKNELSEEEKNYFVYAGKFMIYMQAIRFLADYLNNDVYYGSKYPGHNLIRCNNQLELLQQLLAKEELLQSKVSMFIAQETPVS